MGSHLRLEEIYDASTDDEEFARLSTRLADALGARSGVVHWRPLDGGDGEEEISYSGYFSQAQMDAFGRHFADDDLWSSAVNAPHAVNQVWECDHLVPESAYENSRIYNEWIRPMGDDSFHAMGAALRTSSAVVEIGFHRGRSQGRFDPKAVTLLKDCVGHVARSIEIRTRLRGAEERCGIVAGSLDTVGYALFSLAADGRVLHRNAAAEALLVCGDPLKLVRGKLRAVDSRESATFAEAIQRAGKARAPLPTALRIHAMSGRPLELSVVSVPSPAGRRIVVAAQSQSRDCSLPDRIRSLWGLSAAEVEIAMRLSEGVSPRELSAERQTSLDTIRTQIKSLSAKMGLQRQAEIVAAVKNLPRLRLIGNDR